MKTLLLKKKKSTFYWGWTILLMLNVLSFIFTGSPSNEVQFGMIKGVLLSSLPFYPIYFFSQNGILKKRYLIALFFVLLPLGILSFYFNREQVLSVRISNDENIVNNVAYTFVGLIPFLYLFQKRKIISALFMLLLIFYIIQGAKRGAIFVGAIGVLIYLIDLFSSMKYVNKKKKIIVYFVSLASLIAIIYYSNTFYANNEFLVSRMSRLDEGGSGRDIIYKKIFSAWCNSESIFQLLFGYGFASSTSLNTNHVLAHNDWLELLSNLGILGVVVYLSLFFSTYKLFRLRNWPENHMMMFLSVVLMWFVTTLFSMGYTSMDGYVRAILLAYLIGYKEFFDRKGITNMKYH